MSGTLDRIVEHGFAPGFERVEDPAVVEQFFGLNSGLGEMWLLIGAMGLVYVLLARTARRRRNGTNTRPIRQLEAAARRESFRQIGTDLRLRHEAGGQEPH